MRPSLEGIENPPPTAHGGAIASPAKRSGLAVRLLVLAGIGLAGVLVFVLTRPAPEASEAARPPAALSVTVEPVQKRLLARTLMVTGSIAAWDELPIGAELTGLRIEGVYVEEGERVQRGQLLARLNDRPLRAQIRQVEAEIARGRALIAQSRANFAEARALRGEAEANRHRFDDLQRQGAISEVEATARRTSADTYGARLGGASQAIAVAESDLARAEARREELLAMLAQTRITAPAEGLISKRQAKLGSVVSPLSAQALFTLVRDRRLELQAEVSEVRLGAIAPGQAVAVQTDALPERRFAGRVREIAPAVDAGSRNALVKIDLPLDPALRPGMFARGELRFGAGPALAVPEGALIFDNGRAHLFVVQGEKAVRRAVETGARSGGQVEITGGLAAGEQIVLAGAGYLKDGARVRTAGGAS
ncbi:efflux RND transporter periplasmic adaptor subunit [Gloeobacter violaceus]|nr:efflux RND transporter periplasmic adaptor subunit [Gloeobacter violaceus]